MSYYWFNRKELLQKAKDRYHNGDGKKKLLNIILKTGFYLKNANNNYKWLSEEEKEAKREYQRNRCRSMKVKTNRKIIKQLKD